VKIEIGGGLAPAPDHINLDPVHGEGVWKRRIQRGIPVPDGSVEAVRASHMLEHLLAGQERIDLFNEVWRALRPNGPFEIIVPLFPGWGALADPTHLSFWVKQSFDYFTGDRGALADYGILPWYWDSWMTKRYEWGNEGHAILRKARVP